MDFLQGQARVPPRYAGSVKRRIGSVIHKLVEGFGDAAAGLQRCGSIPAHATHRMTHLSMNDGFARIPGPRPPLSLDDAQRVVDEAKAGTVVLVEGWSDQAAIETLAHRVGLNLAAMAIVVLPIGGATNARPFAARFGPQGLQLRLAGLYDAPEERHFLRALCSGVVASAPNRTDAEKLGFYACSEDLEDELIRALGPKAVEQVIAAEGETGALRRFQVQPAQRGRAVDAHLRRFIGTRSGRKIRYGALLAAALDLGKLPSPLSRLLARLASCH
jgi:hypothetical protein